MGIMTPQAPLTTTVAKAVAKGTKKGLVPERSRISIERDKREQAAEASRKTSSASSK
jgi:hypothetical protein